MKNSVSEFIDCVCDVNVMNVCLCRKSVGTEKVAPLVSSPLPTTVTRMPPVLRLREGEVGLEHTYLKDGKKVIRTVKVISMSEKGFVTAVESGRFRPGALIVEDRKHGPLPVLVWLQKRNLAKDDKWRSNSTWFLHDNIRHDFKTLQGFLKVCPRENGSVEKGSVDNGSVDNAMGTTDAEDEDMCDVEAESIPRVRELRVSLQSVVAEHGAREVAAADTAGADVNALERHEVGAGADGTEDAVDESGNAAEG